MLEQVAVQLLNGLVNGMILALVASGLTLIFGIMDVVNFAHGELYMLGAYVGTTTLAVTGSFWLALVGAAVAIFWLGVAVQIVALRPLLGRDPLTTILATFGVSLVLQNYALWQYGPVARRIPEPVAGHFRLFYLDYPWYRVIVAALAAAILAALWLFLAHATWGVWIRAVTQDRVMAAAMGIPVCPVRWSASTRRSVSASFSGRSSSWSWGAWATSSGRSWRRSSSACSRGWPPCG